MTDRKTVVEINKEWAKRRSSPTWIPLLAYAALGAASIFIFVAMLATL